MQIEQNVPDQVYNQEDFKLLKAQNPIFFQYIIDYFQKGSGFTVGFEKKMKANGINVLDLSIEVLTHFMGQSASILLGRCEMYTQSQSMPGKEITSEKFFARSGEAIKDICNLIISTPEETWTELVRSHSLNVDDPEWSNIGGYFKSSAEEIKNNLESNNAADVAKTLEALLRKYMQIVKANSPV